MDTAVSLPGRWLYVFSGGQVWRYTDPHRWVPDFGYPKPITSEFPGAFQRDLDAALLDPDGGLYLFRGNQHLRYDLTAGRPEPGYPRRYAPDWPGVFPDRIDAAITWGPDIIYLFRGDAYTSFSPRQHRARLGYPKPIRGNWPGIPHGPITSAFTLPGNRTVFLADAPYLVDTDGYARTTPPTDLRPAGMSNGPTVTTFDAETDGGDRLSGEGHSESPATIGKLRVPDRARQTLHRPQLESWTPDPYGDELLEFEELAPSGHSVATMTQSGDVEGDSADTTVGYDYQGLIDPGYVADPGDEPSEIWAEAQTLREILDKRGELQGPERRPLRNALLYQLQTLGLYREIKLAKSAAKASGQKQVLNLYVLLFPGEGRHNTGIKDLNDKVLGYKVNSGFIKKRQCAIAKLFWDVETVGPRYVNVGQDYKTASIVAYDKSREDFAGDLVNLDAQLRQDLLDSLDEAEKDPVDDKQRAEIKKLRKVLQRDKKYRFDYLFGSFSLDPATYQSDVAALFLLLTQALKGAGIARFVSKAASQKSRETAKIAGGTGVKLDGKKLDARGKSFDLNAFRTTTNAADQIKTFVSTPYNRDRPYDYINILVDSVWDWAFLYYRKLWSGNPDVIRDVRKKLLVEPTLKQGLKYTFRAQVELLELWLVALNELDFVKDFLLSEFRKELVAYHELCYAAFTEACATSGPIDWDRLEKVLTHDLRLTQDRVLVQGTASEYQFYAYAADNDQQIFFTMDVRDLGVEVILWYELSSWIVWEDKLSDTKLLEETIESTKPVIQRRRATYDAVVAVMKKYFDSLVRGADGRTAALRAFETGVRTPGFVSDFKETVQVMLGGDEVFVAAHPYFARYVTDIISDLDKATFKSDSHGHDIGERPLNMRVSVAYSSAKMATGGPASAALSPAQRLENRRSHDRALRLGGSAAGALKTLERTQRRIERLIELMEANEKKAKQAPQFRDRLAKLGLLQLYVQVQYANTAQLSTALYKAVLAALDAGDLITAQGFKLVDLVDFNGNIVDAKKLTTDAANLEADVSKVVGMDNYHQDGPPVDQRGKKIVDGIIDIIKGKDPKTAAAETNP